MITNQIKLANLSKLHYINIAVVPSIILGNPSNPNEHNTATKNTIKQYENHSSIINIKNHIDSPATRFDIPTAKIEIIIINQ